MGYCDTADFTKTRHKNEQLLPAKCVLAFVFTVSGGLHGVGYTEWEHSSTLQDIPMFDHVKFGVSDFALSKAFFLNALAPLGVKIVAEGEPDYGVELCPDRGNVSLCLFQTDEKPAHLHLAFTASSREQVDAFYHAALSAGGKDNGAPGLRPNYHAHYYAAFVIGPDGHNIEAVCHNAIA